MYRSHRNQNRTRRGSVLVLSAVLMVCVFAILAFTVDLGQAYVNRAEMQRAADSAALAGVNELLDQQILNPLGTQSESVAAQTALQFASMNNIGSISPQVADSDIEVGTLANRDNPSGPILSDYGGLSNAVRVRIKRTAELNGETPFFFAPVLGHSSVAQEVEATAAYVSSFRGFTVGRGGRNLGILPLALDNQTWEDLQHNGTSDNWTWDPKSKTILPGPDGIHEANLFPQDTGMPGNRGTVDIGHGGNSTADIKRQITDGISAEDLSYHGGSLEFDSNGEIALNGDTGISAGIKSQLDSVKGSPRIIPIFEHVAGNGNNATYTITKFVGVRIMEVDLSGSAGAGGPGKGKGHSGGGDGFGNGKRVIVQPAVVLTDGGIPDDESIESRTQFIHSRGVLVD